MEAGREVEGERVEFIVLVEPRRLEDRLRLGRGDAMDMMYCNCGSGATRRAVIVCCTKSATC